MIEEKIKRVTVIGAGVMGHSIAQEFAQNGYQVVLIGRRQNKLEASVHQIEKNLIESDFEKSI